MSVNWIKQPRFQPVSVFLGKTLFLVTREYNRGTDKLSDNLILPMEWPQRVPKNRPKNTGTLGHSKVRLQGTRTVLSSGSLIEKVQGYPATSSSVPFTPSLHGYCDVIIALRCFVDASINSPNRCQGNVRQSMRRVLSVPEFGITRFTVKHFVSSFMKSYVSRGALSLITQSVGCRLSARCTNLCKQLCLLSRP